MENRFGASEKCGKPRSVTEKCGNPIGGAETREKQRGASETCEKPRCASDTCGYINLSDRENQCEGRSQTNKIHKHEACSYGYKVVCCYDDEYSKPFKMFRSLNSINEFVVAIFEREKKIAKLLKQFSHTDMILTTDQKREYSLATSCYVCEGKFIESNYKVRDHCHVMGTYRGASCNRCNLGMKLSSVIPVVFS